TNQEENANQILFRSERSKVELDSSSSSIIWTANSFLDDEEFRYSFISGLNHFKSKIQTISNLAWINDTKKFKTPKVESMKWLSNEFNELAYAAGLRKIAFVLPEDVFGRLGIRLYAHISSIQFQDKFQIKAFNTLDNAKLWIKGEDLSNIEEIKLTINQKP
ncbi:MAG: hypothetical protein SFU25_01445, partial [Candidatus Caenarcaniphilales bacterium]|nr:hypothetical protein [Candidatus Caenarcaniphilales bacterium]